MHANSVQSANPEPIQSQSRHRFGLAGPKPILYFPCQSMSMQRPIRSQCWLKGLGYEGHTDANRLPILSQLSANRVAILGQSCANWRPMPRQPSEAYLEPILSQSEANPKKPILNESLANLLPIGQSGANRPIRCQSANFLPIRCQSANPVPIRQFFANPVPIRQSCANPVATQIQSSANPEPIGGQS